MRKSQNQAILESLQRGERITPLEAANQFKCMRLASRINDLRKAGHPVFDKWIVDERTGKRYKQYFMLNPGRQMGLEV